jgi:hypothetical protein
MTIEQQVSLKGPLADMDVATDLLDVCLGCAVILAVPSGVLYVAVRWIWPIFNGPGDTSSCYRVSGSAGTMLAGDGEVECPPQSDHLNR